MPETWATAMEAVWNGVTSSLGFITDSVLLTVLTFGFVFGRKVLGLLKKAIRLGGKG